MRRGKLAVVVPVYNGARTLRASLQCIADQDLHDFHVYICNNVSTDGTEAIAKEFCDADDRFELVNFSEHLAGLDNFARCMRLFRDRYEYVCLRACDDGSNLAYLSLLLRRLEADKSKWLAAGSVDRISAGRRQHLDADPAILGFPGKVRSGRLPNGFNFPAEWFYGMFRAEGLDLVLSRMFDLGTPWCAASYVVAAFVARDLVAYEPAAVHHFYEGAGSYEKYSAKTVVEKLRQRIRYTRGCYAACRDLGALSIPMRVRLLNMFWRDARRKTRYRILGFL